MPKHAEVRLDDRLADFIERQVKQGHYDSASDVVSAGLRLLEEQEVKLEALRAALIEGEQSGPSAPFDVDAFIEKKHRQRATSK